MRRLAAKRLLPGEGHDIEPVPRQRLREGGRGRVADRQAPAIGGDRGRWRDADARGRAVPGEDHVMVEVHVGEIDDAAVGRLQYPRVGEFQLLYGVGDPALAEALPGHDVDGPGAEQRPHRHLDRARIRARHDADPVIGGDLEKLAGEVDRQLQLGLADLGAVRAAERRILQRLEGPAGALGAGARRETGISRPAGRLCGRHLGHPSRWKPPVGGRCPADGDRSRGSGGQGPLTTPADVHGRSGSRAR